MNRNIRQTLRQIVRDFKTSDFPLIKERDFQIQNWFSGDVRKIVTLTGFRRVGKTYLLLDYAKKIGKENCVYINLEDERLPRDVAVLTELLTVLEEEYGKKELVLLLDEIQEIPDWSRWARRVNESRKYNLILSGSSSKLALSEVPSELRGRTVQQQVFPLSFAEFVSWRGMDGPLLLQEYLKFGGFPEVVLSDLGKKPILLDEYFQTFLGRDVIERNHPRQESAMRDLISLILTSSHYTIGRLQKSLASSDYKIGKTTVSNYVNYLVDAYFVKPLEVYSFSVKSRLQQPKKPYFVDTFFVSRLAANFSENTGRLMEQAVGNHLFRKLSADTAFGVFYWKNYQNQEVDFVVTISGRVENLIQVSFVSTPLEIAEREIDGLVKAAKEVKCFNLTLVTWDYEAEIDKNGFKIKCVPLAEFLKD